MQPQEQPSVPARTPSESVARGQERTGSAVSAVVAYLKEQVLSGVVRPGDRIAPERQLAERLGVSRPMVREALRSLDSLGIIRIEPGRGAYVVKPSARILSDFVSLALARSEAASESVLELRIILECGAARLAASRRSLEELAEIRAALQRMPTQVTNDDVGAQADYDFHVAVVRATHNPALMFVYQSIEELLRKSHYERRVAVFNLPGALERLVQAHVAIYHAIRDGDPELAERRMRDHFFVVTQAYEALPPTTPPVAGSPGRGDNS